MHPLHITDVGCNGFPMHSWLHAPDPAIHPGRMATVAAEAQLSALVIDQIFFKLIDNAKIVAHLGSLSEFCASYMKRVDMIGRCDTKTDLTQD